MHLAHLHFTLAQGEGKRQILVPVAKWGLANYWKVYREPNANKKNKTKQNPKNPLLLQRPVKQLHESYSSEGVKTQNETKTMKFPAQWECV